MMRNPLTLFGARLLQDGSLDRQHERHRRVVLTAVASLISRAGSIVALLVTVPLALDHLGAERFGMWMVISAFAAVMTFADFGIGNGVLNSVASASADDDVSAIVTAASSGLVILLTVGGLIGGAMAIAYPFVPWDQLFQVTSAQAVVEAGPAVAALIASVVVVLPASLASKVQFGLQQGYSAQLWVGVGGLLSLASVLIVLALDGGTPSLVLAFFGSQAVALVLNTLHFFGRQRPDLRPRLSSVEWRATTALFGLGMGFFVLQLVQLVTFRVDALIVTQYFGPEQAGYYAVVDRAFVLTSMVVLMALAPLWPAYGEAAGRGDLEWLRKTLVRSVALAAGATVLVSAVVLVFNEAIFSTWLGRPTSFPVFLLLGFAVWRTLEAAGTAVAMLMNGLGAIRIQAAMAVAMAICATALKLMFAVRLDMAWVNWMTSASYLIWFLLPSVFVIPWLLRRLDAKGRNVVAGHPATT